MFHGQDGRCRSSVQQLLYAHNLYLQLHITEENLYRPYRAIGFHFFSTLGTRWVLAAVSWLAEVEIWHATWPHGNICP